MFVLLALFKSWFSVAYSEVFWSDSLIVFEKIKSMFRHTFITLYYDIRFDRNPFGVVVILVIFEVTASYANLHPKTEKYSIFSLHVYAVFVLLH